MSANLGVLARFGWVMMGVPSVLSACTVQGDAPSVRLVISPESAVLSTGGTQQFTVGAGVPVTWSVTESAGAADTRAYPLKVSSSGRYLVDQDDNPWRIQADAAWLLSSVATPAQVDAYLATRESQGFNAFYLMAMVHPGGYAAAPSAPNNHAGAPPFASGSVFTTPYEPYWAWIDSIIARAAAHRMVVMLAFEYLGYQGGAEGWASEVAARSEADSIAWGTWLGNRYRSTPNLIWFGLGDHFPPSGGALENRHLAAINAIKAAGATQPWMAEGEGGPGGPLGLPGNNDTVLDEAAFSSAIDMHSFYGYGSGSGDLAANAERCYRASPSKPAWVQEPGYEYENNTGHFQAQPWETRRSRLWSVLAGGTAGDGFGSRDAYNLRNFPASLATPGATFSKNAFAMLAMMPWWDLRPSGTWPQSAGKILIPSGGGTRGAGSMDEITSALTSDGRFLLAYVPTAGGRSARSFSVDMSAMAGPARARWWDPATGAYATIDSGYANSGTRSFTTPGMNGGGQDDWVLILDTLDPTLCGTVSSDGWYTAPLVIPAGVTCLVTATLRSDPSVTANAGVTFR